MKTAISIPDPVFEAAEDFAKKTGVSRSELFSNAVTEYMERHRYQSVTESLNKIYGDERSSLDKELVALQTHTIQRDEW